MIKNIKNKFHNGSSAFQFRHILVVLMVFLLLPLTSVHAEEPPSETNNNTSCIAYAYTESSNHYFLLETNKSAFGSNITVKHNCEYIEVFINGNFSAFTELNEITIPINSGFTNIKLTSNNYSKNISNVNIFPDRLNWEFEFYEWENRNNIEITQFISLVKAESRENWASILSIVMVFSLVTMVYWNLINSYIDRNYCEEVIR